MYVIELYFLFTMDMNRNLKDFFNQYLFFHLYPTIL